MLLDTPRPVEQRPLELGEVPEPAPGPRDIVVRVSFCGVCRTDLHEVEGELPLLRSPVIPGHQVVGTVSDAGSQARRFAPGARVGIAWLHETCGACPHCHGGAENLCENAKFTGWTHDGGYAEFTKVPEAFAYPTLRISGVKPGQRLGLYGFGASAHIAIQVARHWGCEVYVFTRTEANREHARRLGAVWVGEAKERPPLKSNASIIFAPAGPLVLDALDVLEKGGTVALAGIYMSEIPPMDYTRHLYDEKVVRSVANATRRDGEELLEIAARIPIHTTTQVFPLEQADEALLAVKTSRTTGAAVLRVG